MVILLSNTSDVSDDSIEFMLHAAYAIFMLNLKPPTDRLKAMPRSNEGTQPPPLLESNLPKTPGKC
jgi:hypothetical protein